MFKQRPVLVVKMDIIKMVGIIKIEEEFCNRTTTATCLEILLILERIQLILQGILHTNGEIPPTMGETSLTMENFHIGFRTPKIV